MELNERAFEHGFVVDDPVFANDPPVLDGVPSNELLELRDELVAPADEEDAFLEQRPDVDDLLREEIEKLEEVGVGDLVVEVLLDAVEEAKLVGLDESRRAVVLEVRVVGRLHPRRAREALRRGTIRGDVVRGGRKAFGADVGEVAFAVGLRRRRRLLDRRRLGGESMMGLCSLCL